MENLFLKERFNLTLRIIAIARIVMKDINIVASTAMQTIYPFCREKAIACGANVIMPNLTPGRYRAGHRIYEFPVVWKESGKTTVKRRDIWDMGRAIFRLWWQVHVSED